jgi:hypothetical protein
MAQAERLKKKLPHDRQKMFCFPSHEKKKILTEEGSEIFFLRAE